MPTMKRHTQSMIRSLATIVFTLVAAGGLVLSVASSATQATTPAAAYQRSLEPGADRETISVSGEPVDVHYGPGQDRVARRVAEICAETLPRLARELGVFRVEPIDIDITDDISRYRRQFGNDLPAWGVAFALMGRDQMVVDAARATRAWNSLETVIPHELSHLLIAQRIGRVAVPIWFLEGLAQWQADEWSLVDSWQLMNAVWSREAPKLWNLQGGYPEGEEQARAAYRLSYTAFTRLFAERKADLPRFLNEVAEIGDFAAAFEAFFGESLAVYYDRFQRDIEERYHSRLLLFQTGPLFSLIAAAFLLVALRYHLRKRRKLKRMEAAERGLSLDDDENRAV